jgi:hypothetical protein
MTLYEELNQTFGPYTHFYIVTGHQLLEAQNLAARLSGEEMHIIEYRGSVVACAKHSLGSETGFLLPVEGTPTE